MNTMNKYEMKKERLSTLCRFPAFGVAVFAWGVGFFGCELHAAGKMNAVLTTDKLKAYVTQFNADDDELFPNIPNREAFVFLEKNIPLFECPDQDFERTYYFRWWTYRKHVKSTADGTVVTEFMPKVGWAGKHNTISCPAGHHFYEGRWLHDQQVMDDYATFWLRKGGSARSYSFPIADAYYARNLVAHHDAFLIDLLPDLIRNYEAWETGWAWGNAWIGQRDNGLFYTICDREGMEVSISGDGFRPTLNSYMYADARAIADIARMAGNVREADRFEKKAATLKGLIQDKLWDEDAQFFKVLPGERKPQARQAQIADKPDPPLRDVKELAGLIPWQFNLPDPGYEAGWKELMDPKGFYAPYGPTFAEQRHPQFTISYEGHECQWNGPSWPMATSSVLTGLANLLNNYDQDVIGKEDYFETLKIYTQSHRLKREDGKVVPWIDENLNPYTGDWIARTRLHEWAETRPDFEKLKGGKDRGKDYNHSSYNDLIITGLVGLRPRADDVVEVNPLLPDGTWDYFCLDNILYHGRILTIIWDKTGDKYNRGQGLTVFADGKSIGGSTTLSRIVCTLK
jgi:hypothetical protein